MAKIVYIYEKHHHIRQKLSSRPMKNEGTTNIASNLAVA